MIPTGFTKMPKHTDEEAKGNKTSQRKSRWERLRYAADRIHETQKHTDEEAKGNRTSQRKRRWERRQLEATAQQLHVFLATKHHSASARERQGRGRKGKHNESEYTDEERELVPLSVLKHDNVIRLLTVFLHGGLMHAIFELLEHSLCDELKKKGCGLESLTIKKYSFQILRAVDFIHSRNIMHRDIKPDNLLVSRSGVLKLADFGSGRASNHAAVPLTRAAGTMWFSAPEMLVMDPDYNKPVDVWAVGCTLVFMATGNYFLKGERFLEHIKMIITKVGPLTAIQEQQYLNNVKYATDFGALPVVHPTTDLKEKYGISDPLLAQLVEMCLQMDPVDRWR
ncbi:unnamed protein product [Boreogadus saida]